MAEGILGLGSGQAASLNQELIDKLKEAETKAKIEPIETDIEEMETERETFSNIETLVDDLLASVKPFDLYVSGGVTAFQEKSASTSGDSVVFDAADVSALNTGVTTVDIQALAQKDVYQSSSFTQAQKDAFGDVGVLTIAVGSESYDFNTASYDTLDDLASAINSKTEMNATVEQVGSDSYRLVIKSAESGIDNALTISGTAASSLNIGDEYTNYDYTTASIAGASSGALGDEGILTVNGTSYDTSLYATYDDLIAAIDGDANLNASAIDNGDGTFSISIENIDKTNQVTISGSNIGFSENSTTFFEDSHVLVAQDMKAIVDGVEYNVATNDLTVDGLQITATKTGQSSINVAEDTTDLSTSMQTFVDNFNLLVGTINAEIANAESALSDKSAMRGMVSDLKEKLFGLYGENNDKSIFNYGFELTEDGLLTLNTTEFNKAVNDDLDGLKDLFIGTAEKEGLGTQFKALVDEMTFTSGVLDTYEKSMDSRKENLDDELEKAQEDLDDKYAQLASQFAAYAGIITQYESSFSGLQMIIQSEYSS